MSILYSDIWSIPPVQATAQARHFINPAQERYGHPDGGAGSAGRTSAPRCAVLPTTRICFATSA